MARRDRRRELARIAAPVAFLLAVTIAVLLVRSGLRSGTGSATEAIPPTVPTATRPAATTARAKGKAAPRRQTTSSAAEYYTVERGDTFGSIATKYGTTVAELEALNPGVSSSALSVGQRLRVK